MQTLFTLFSKERGELETEIDKATSMKQVVQLVQTKIDNLEKSYIGELSVSQVRLVKFFLDTLRQSIGTLSTADEATLIQQNIEQIIDRTKKSSPNKLLLKVLQIPIGVGIFTSLFSLIDDTPGVWMPILLVTVLAGLEVALQLDKSGKQDNVELSQSLAALQPSIQVDSKFFLDNLADILSTIDRAVAQVSVTNQPVGTGGIQEMPEMLDFLQKLWGASFLGNPYMALEISKMVPQILMDQGIYVQNYKPNDPQSPREYFDFEPSIDRNSKEYVTLTPALLKGDRLLRRGRVIEPINKTTEN